MDIKFWFYVFLFVIIGIPLIGYVVRSMIRFGKFLYARYPFMRKFFDEYYEHLGLGSIVTTLAFLVYGLLYWLGVLNTGMM